MNQKQTMSVQRLVTIQITKPWPKIMFAQKLATIQLIKQWPKIMSAQKLVIIQLMQWLKNTNAKQNVKLSG